MFLPRRTRRVLLAPVLASTAAFAAVLGPGALPAAAASDMLWVYSDPYEMTLLGPYEDGSGAPSQTLTILVSHDNTNTTVPAGTLSVDVSEIAAFADVSWPVNCRPETDTTATCDTPELPGGGYAPAAAIELTAKADAPDASEGYVRYTAHGGGMTSWPGETRVAVGNGPALGVTQAASVTDLAPGTRFDAPVTLANKGNRTADRTLLTLFTSRGVKLRGPVPSNCEYNDTPTGRTLLCTLDEKAAPGSYHTLPLRLRAKDNALFDRIDYSVQPYSDQALDEQRHGQVFTSGAGDELNLSPAPATDEETDPYRILSVRAKNTADYRLTGSQITGAAGETVQASVAVRNRGPAWVASLSAGDPAATVDVNIPAGTTVTAKPENCEARTASGGYRGEQLGAPRYRCFTPLYLTEAGTESTHRFVFDLRIGEVIPGSSATAAIWNDAYEPPVRAFDPNLANNESRIVVNP
ncbi:hypothetical protein AB0I82_05660 [Streptomyces sp. NPDC050315]|uniref:hypothetical protein n=1 Tax=Streptomyces sp. NPDC050315 TaxID=3155039 RepID=UPI003419E665